LTDEDQILSLLEKIKEKDEEIESMKKDLKSMMNLWGHAGEIFVDKDNVFQIS